jgi:hypothetical protein
MKKSLSLVTFIFFLFSTSISFAQIRKIPAEVTQGLKDKYPMATEIEWKDKIRGFTATFFLDEEKHVANFTNEGIWESTETDIEDSSLPEVVRDSYSKSKYADWEIGGVQKIELPEEKVQYRVLAVKSEFRRKNLYYNPEGRLLKDKTTL